MSFITTLYHWIYKRRLIAGMYARIQYIDPDKRVYRDDNVHVLAGSTISFNNSSGHKIEITFQEA